MSFQLHGSYKHRVINLWDLICASASVSSHRAKGKHLKKTWSWAFEAANLFARKQTQRAMSMASIAEARQLIDSIGFDSPHPTDLHMDDSNLPGVNGVWLRPKNAKSDRTTLYCHGGGYAFFARAHINMIGHIACAARSRTFALNYRLTPEHPYPAQLEDAYDAYLALLASGCNPQSVVLAGDSAGGHLVLSLLAKLRQTGVAMPALALCLCPWTEVGVDTPELYNNDRYDWVQGVDTLQFAQWLQGSMLLASQVISPMAFDLAGFPPLYIQAGGCEVLYDMIVRFAHRAADKSAEVTLDVWPDMTHDFQAFGAILQESQQALARVGEAVEHYVGKHREAQMRASSTTVLQRHRENTVANTLSSITPT